MYGGYAWLTNVTPPTSDHQRVLLLVGMGGFLVAALAVPNAFGASGITFGAAYHQRGRRAYRISMRRPPCSPEVGAP